MNLIGGGVGLLTGGPVLDVLRHAVVLEAGDDGLEAAGVLVKGLHEAAGNFGLVGGRGDAGLRLLAGKVFKRIEESHVELRGARYGMPNAAMVGEAGEENFGRIDETKEPQERNSFSTSSQLSTRRKPERLTLAGLV